MSAHLTMAPPWAVDEFRYELARIQWGHDHKPEREPEPEDESPRRVGRLRRLTGRGLVATGRWLQGQPVGRTDQPSFS